MRRLSLTFLLFALMGLAIGSHRAAAAELVMFEDPTCVYCARWRAEIGPGYPHTEEGRRAPLRRVHIKDQGSLGGMLARPITATPTFVLVENGREWGRIIGYPGPDYFYPMLDEILDKLPRRPERFRPGGLRNTSAEVR